MDYTVLNWSSASELKKSLKGEIFTNIDFNLSSIYLFEDSSYLITPLNPFGNSILTKNKLLLDSWIKKQRFPIIDEETAFYFNNQIKIDSILDFTEELKRDLFRYAFKDENLTNPAIADIEKIYQILKKRKKIKEYKLNFIVLVGDYILNINKEYRWGILNNKQLLNPLVNLVIVKGEKTGIYYNLEENISGKWGYPGLHYILRAVLESNKKHNEIEEIVKIL